MLRTIALLLVVAGIGAAADVGRGADLDEDTRAGMAAEVREDWTTAMAAYERAVAAAPDDAIRKARRDAARDRGYRAWRAMAEAAIEAKAWRTAARSVAMARTYRPGDGTMKTLARRITREGVIVPEELPERPPASPSYPFRSSDGKLRVLRGLPMGPRALELIRGAQDALRGLQSEDGHWDAKATGGYPLFDVGITGLALSALLVDGPEALSGPDGDAARKAVEWLLSKQDDEGAFGPRRSNRFTYDTSVATRAVAEYAALAGDTKRLRSALKRARQLLLRARNPGAAWRYGIQPGDSDASVAYWALSALDRLRRAGIEIDPGPMREAATWVRSVTEPSTGLGGYTSRGTGSARPQDIMDKYPPDRTQAMTAAACCIRRLAGVPEPALDALQRGLMKKCPPYVDKPDMYYWRMGMEAFTLSGGVPGDWYEACVIGVISCREQDGSIAPRGPWGRDGGKVYSNAICALALAVPWTAPGAGAAPSPAEFLRTGRRTVRVPAGCREVATGIYLDKSDQVSIVPAGSIVPYEGAPPTGPEGVSKAPKTHVKLSRSSPYACLLGRIGPDGRTFPLKKKRSVRASSHGQLYLLLNTADAACCGGEFVVEIVRK